ncbi:type IV pilus biogenesis protein PilM [Pantoea sp. At-9b]|uniref:type IV pilus biogenesis protein PilM n=1 Tax=Pantoea sp. (strain At-9b) TaxID=592316 RepID=UPI0001B3F248|nr:pilus assembly protein PilM [Pantoea sp. At-9b]ADU70984.1 conserved hypothetical protein [Pantoea sp. At-9b]
MTFQRWQIGLDIQNGKLCTLAIQRRRQGWQLRHWQQQALPEETLKNGVLQSSAALLAALRQWRCQLPSRYSLRVGLPPQLVLQRTLALPDVTLREPALNRYVQASSQRLFPVEPASLALDYRASSASTQLCITAARREVIAQWLEPLQQAGLQPDVFELSSLALAQVAWRLPLRPQQLLIHPLSDHWLWYLAGETPTSGACCEPLSLAQVQATFPGMVSALSTTPMTGFTAVRPFSLLHYLQLPLPDHEGDFALALGLALRPEDA